MSIVLNNLTTTPEYPPEQASGGSTALMRTTAPMVVAEVDVFNAAIYIQFATNPKGESGQAIWQPELFVAPEHRIFVRRFILGVRCRSAVAEKPAQVTICLLPPEETFLFPPYLLGGNL